VAALREFQVTQIFQRIGGLINAVQRHLIGWRKAETPSEQKEKWDRLRDRILQAAKAPPFTPDEYEFVFTAIAAELPENHYDTAKTAQAVLARAGQSGARIAIEDVSFVLDAVEEIDAGFKYTACPGNIARTYRYFVLIKCEEVGIKLTRAERKLIEANFPYARST
jgi:hypothetical protein